MSVQVLNVKLQRTDPSVSWGFNVQGGKEFHSPLLIQKVTPNSLAEKSSIQPGDYILRIGTTVAENFTHGQAREAIMRQGNYLELTLQRGAVPRSDDYNAKFDFPKHQLMTPENVERVPVASPQVGIQLNNSKALLSQSYNSPMGLYSSQNIADSLVSTIKNMDNQEPNKESNMTSLSTSSLSSTSSSVQDQTNGSNSISPVFSSSSSSSNSTYTSSSQSSKPPLPLFNSKPRPFLLKKAQIEVAEQPKKFENVKMIKQTCQNELYEPKKFEKFEIINSDKNNNDVKLEPEQEIIEQEHDFLKYNNPNTFKAIPFRPSFELKKDEFSKRRYSHDPSTARRHSSQSPTHLAKNLKDLSNELSARLVQNPTLNNKMKATINGRLLLKSIENSIINENDTLDSNKDSLEEQQTRTKDSSSLLSSKYINLSRAQVSKLDDPNRPSVVQSKTFKLLQETLDKGLPQQETLFYDSIQNKVKIRRCSLNVNLANTNLDQSDHNSRRTSLYKLKFNQINSINDNNQETADDTLDEDNDDLLNQYKSLTDRETSRLNSRSKSLANETLNQRPTFNYTDYIKQSRHNSLFIDTSKTNQSLLKSQPVYTHRYGSFSKPYNTNKPFKFN